MWAVQLQLQLLLQGKLFLNTCVLFDEYRVHVLSLRAFLENSAID